MKYRIIDVFFVLLLMLELILVFLIITQNINIFRFVCCSGMILGTVYNWRKIRKL